MREGYVFTLFVHWQGEGVPYGLWSQVSMLVSGPRSFLGDRPSFWSQVLSQGVPPALSLVLSKVLSQVLPGRKGIPQSAPGTGVPLPLARTGIEGIRLGQYQDRGSLWSERTMTRGYLPLPEPGQGVPPRQHRSQTEYAVGNMPLAVPQEDFLVLKYNCYCFIFERDVLVIYLCF